MTKQVINRQNSTQADKKGETMIYLKNRPDVHKILLRGKIYINACFNHHLYPQFVNVIRIIDVGQWRSEV